MNLEQKRKCKKCGEIKPFSFFIKAKSCKYGISWTCTDCKNEIRRNRRKDNINHVRKMGRIEYANNRENRIKAQHKYRAKNKDKIAAYNKSYKLKNPEKIKEIKRNHRKRQNELDRRRRKTDPKWKLQRTISNYIYQSLCGRKLGKHWEDLVGYNIDELKEHLEKQFSKGMTWDNHGEWHIDHKIPIAVHNFTKPEHEDFKKCWALKNLQPLWARDNLIKHARLGKPFQPSLQM